MKARPQRPAASAALIAIFAVAVAACESSKEPELRADTAESLEISHASVVANAGRIAINAATDMSLIANAAPPIIELDEIDDTPVGRTTTTSAEIGGANEGPAPSTPVLGAPKSASEAAERNNGVGPRSSPPSSVVTPEAVSPTAPAETVSPR